MIPFPHPKPTKASNYKVSLARPSKVNVVGSYVLQTMIDMQGEDASIDMIVVIAESMFQEKDYLNLRYFYKRAYFLAHLAAATQKQVGDHMEVEFEHFGENALLPVLVLRPKEMRPSADSSRRKSMGGYTVRIIPCAPESLFPRRKLLPTKNCVRPVGDSKEKALEATPFYNSSLIAEMLYTGYLRLLHHTSGQCPAFKDALILGRIWLRQRGVGSKISKGGFGHFEFAVLAAMLLRPENSKNGDFMLKSSSSSTQIFRTVLRFLATANFGSRPFVFGTDSVSSLAMSENDGPVILDSQRGHNIVYKMTPWCATLVQRHAQWSCAVFLDCTAEKITPLLTAKADIPHQMYDLMVKVEATAVKAHQSLDKKERRLIASERVHEILKRALGDRVSLINIDWAEKASWALGSKTPSNNTGHIRINIVLHPTNITRKMEKGPSAAEKGTAAEFRQFWGEKSELRRFQDGSMTENVLWSQRTQFGICEEIIKHILQRHLGLHSHQLEFYGSELPSRINASAADAEAFVATIAHFNQLERNIRQLENLPLHVRLVSPTAPELRYSSLELPPSTHKKKDPSRALDVVISFEASGKWPENLVAIQRTKMAFLARIGTLLEESSRTITTRIGFEDSPADIENIAFLDVVYEGAVTFRLRIHSELEVTILEKQAKDKLLEQHVKTESARLLAKLRRACVTLPVHTQVMIKSCSMFPALSPTMRLLKRWFAAHKLSNHFTDDLIELFAANTFLRPYPWDKPGTAGTGFLRTLQWLARWDWRDEALVLDFSGEMKVSVVEAIETRFRAWRKIDPNLNRTVLFVATDRETSGTAFTQFGPRKVVAARMTSLARTACKLVRGVDRHGFLDTEALFRPCVREFDFVIRLNREVVRETENGAGGYLAKNRSAPTSSLSSSSVATVTIPRQPVTTLMDQLERAYGDVVIFFRGTDHDVRSTGVMTGTPGTRTDNDAIILGVWNQGIGMRTFRPRLPCSFMPVTGKKGIYRDQQEGSEGHNSNSDSDEDDENELVEVNRTGILAEIARIGGGLIESIEVKES